MKAIIIFISVFFSCNIPLEKSKVSQINKIEIKYVHLNILTTINVNCQDFNKYFGNIQRIELLKEEDISVFLNFFDGIIKKNKEYKGKIDARGEIIIYDKKGRIEKCCIGNYLTEINGVVYENTDEFQDYITKLLK